MNKNILTIIKGSGIAIIITVISLLILSFALAYTNLSEGMATPIIIGIIVVSIIIGSMITSQKAKKKGLLNGGAVGIIYMVTIYFIASIVLKDFSFNLYTILAITFAIAAGIIGGIIGVNLY